MFVYNWHQITCFTGTTWRKTTHRSLQIYCHLNTHSASLSRAYNHNYCSSVCEQQKERRAYSTSQCPAHSSDNLHSLLTRAWSHCLLAPLDAGLQLMIQWRNLNKGLAMNSCLILKQAYLGHIAYSFILWNCNQQGKGGKQLKLPRNKFRTIKTKGFFYDGRGLTRCLNIGLKFFL